MKWNKFLFYCVLMVATVLVIADTIDGDAAILRGVGSFFGSLFGGLVPDVQIGE